MIAPEIVQQIRRLLAENNLSQRAIARIAAVSRGTVGAIASGKRIDRRRRPQAPEEEEPTGPPERCPGCGGKVYLPCRVCRTRAAKAESPRSPIAPWIRHLDEPVGLDLKDEHRRRYEAIRARRLAADYQTPHPPESQVTPEDEGDEPEFGQPNLCVEPDFGSADFWDELQVTVL